MPSAAALVDYNSKYFLEAHGGIPTDPHAIAFFKAMAAIRAAHVDQYLRNNHVSAKRILEVGPGQGFFAAHWMNTHAGTEYFGFESDTESQEILRKLGLKVVERLDEEEVDLVVMSHVVEHVSHPGEFIRNATASLRSGGALFIEVPCRDDLHKPQDEPHLLFFDKKPLALLLENLGFICLDLSYHGQTLAALKSQGRLAARYNALRSRFVARGWLAPFALKRGLLAHVEDPLGRALAAPFAAHKTQSKPSWWLRACALKR
jgi:SAM-dependent methyltransferase